MSLPTSYTSPSEYFRDAFAFVEKYSWIFKTSNTKFIKEGVIESIPKNWIEYFSKISLLELNNFPEIINTDIAPNTLIEFQKSTLNIRPSYNEITINQEIPKLNLKKISLKKAHEITILARKILQIVNNEENVIFIDFGCGLGYLSEILFQLDNTIKLIGLECDSERVISANKRLQDFYLNAKGNINFVQHFINESSAKFIEENIRNFYSDIQNPKIVIIGLHSCADLTNISMQIFLENYAVKNLIIMPCCYHKLQTIDTDCNEDFLKFKNFPVSQELKKVITKDDILNRPFLRLACQQTKSRWKDMTEKDHFDHGNEMFTRGLLEVIRNNDEIIVKKKNIKDKDSFNLDQIINNYEFKSEEDKKIIPWNEERTINLQNLTLKYPNGPKIAEALTCLQTSIQGICENVFLLDRVCFLEEESKLRELATENKFEKILNDKISPRCFALISKKL